MFVSNEPSRSESGTQCQSTGKQAPLSWTCNTPPTYVYQSQIGYNGRTLPIKGVDHKLNNTWMATPYTRRMYLDKENSPCVQIWKYPSGFYHKHTGAQSRRLTTGNWDTMQNLGHALYAPIFSNLQSRADTECLNKISDSDINIGEALGESREAFAMIAESAAKLAKAIVLAKHGHWKKLADHLGIRKPRSVAKTTSSKWLEYQYGWRPLMSDIYGLHSEFQKGLSTQWQTFTVSRSVSDSTLFSWVWGAPLIGDLNKVTFKVDLGVNTSITFRVADPTVARLNQLGLANPASVAWELVPWSFAIDWFIPVGNFLQACTARAGMSFVTGSRSRRLTHSWEGSYPLRSVSGLPDKLDSFERGSGSAKGIVVSRQVLGNFPTPKIYSNPSPFSTTRAANAVALALTSQKLF